MVCLRVLMLTAALLLVGSGSSNAAESGATPVSGVVTGGLRKHHAELRGSEPLGNRLLHSARHGDVAATTAVVSLRLTAPSKGQTVTAGSSVTVAWQSSGSGVTLDMTLCLQRVCNMPITTGLSSLAEQYTWDVPDGLSDSSSYQIELASTADNVTVLGPMFTVKADKSDGTGYGPFLGVGFALLVLFGLCIVCYFHRRRTSKLKRRRIRLELAHTRQQERLLFEYERRYKLLLPRSTLPYTGGTLVCGDNKWMYTAGPTGLDNPAGVLQCVAGRFKSAEFWWEGSNKTGTVELRPHSDVLSNIGYCDWDGDVLRWHSPVRVRRRGAGYVWRYETSDDLTHFMLHGVRRGVSFADEIVPDGHEPSSIFPRLWAMDYSSNGTVLAPKRRTDEFLPVGLEGSVPPLIALCVALMEACAAEAVTQRKLYETQAAGEREEELGRKRQRALRLYGRIAVVSKYADAKVQVVNHDHPDMRIQVVGSAQDADKPCMWKIVPVNASPDYCVQIVKRNPDFTVKYVKSFPGVCM